MTIFDQASCEFQQIMAEDYDREISLEEVKEQGSRLVEFFDLLIQIDQRQK